MVFEFPARRSILTFEDDLERHVESPHKIDVSRLPALARDRDAAMGAARKAADVCNELQRKRAKLTREIEDLKRESPYSIEGAADKKRRLDDMETRRVSLQKEVGEARAVEDASNEKLQAAACLYDQCAEFVESTR